ncbi:hypothetical protein KKG46_02415, partial [Patescibacteria group bacterium]|nr:hypothetical protein [Patescibacteria group bacterium]
FAILGIAVAVVIVFRHWAEIRLLDPDSIKEEKEKQRRVEMVQQRFNRLQANKIAPIRYFYNRFVLKAKTTFHQAYIKLIKLNRFYEQAKKPFAHVAPTMQERIKVLLDEARSLARDLKWGDAEKRYLEVLRMDNRNADAYKGIGLIYLKQKLVPQAKETFDYLVKVKKADDIVYAALADIAQLEEDAESEEAFRIKAIEARPRLANRYAELAKFYLDAEDYAKAWPAVKRATDLDPKSSKYQELALECLIILGDWIEAKRRYDKLRLISEDKPRLQKYRDRIDRMRPE